MRSGVKKMVSEASPRRFGGGVGSCKSYPTPNLVTMQILVAPYSVEVPIMSGTLMLLRLRGTQSYPKHLLLP